MERRRPSAPFGNPAWTHLNADDLFAEVDRHGHVLRPDLFRMIRRFRRTRIRLIVWAALLAVAVVAWILLPTLGMTIVCVALIIPVVFDTMLVIHLHRKISEAWEDLPREES